MNSDYRTLWNKIDSLAEPWEAYSVKFNSIYMFIQPKTWYTGKDRGNRSYVEIGQGVSIKAKVHLLLRGGRAPKTDFPCNMSWLVFFTCFTNLIQLWIKKKKKWLTPTPVAMATRQNGCHLAPYGNQYFSSSNKASNLVIFLMKEFVNI